MWNDISREYLVACLLLLLASMVFAANVFLWLRTRAEFQKLRMNNELHAAWRRVAPDVRIASIALALEAAMFPLREENSETAVVMTEEMSSNLRLVLRWCQAPMKIATPAEVFASVD